MSGETGPWCHRRYIEVNLETLHYTGVLMQSGAPSPRAGPAAVRASLDLAAAAAAAAAPNNQQQQQQLRTPAAVSSAGVVQGGGAAAGSPSSPGAMEALSRTECLELAEIIRRIGSSDTTQSGLRDLYGFLKGHPGKDVMSHIQQTTQQFQAYVSRGLAKIAEEERRAQEAAFELGRQGRGALAPLPGRKRGGGFCPALPALPLRCRDLLLGSSHTGVQICPCRSLVITPLHERQQRQQQPGSSSSGSPLKPQSPGPLRASDVSLFRSPSRLPQPSNLRTSFGAAAAAAPGSAQQPGQRVGLPGLSMAPAAQQVHSFPLGAEEMEDGGMEVDSPTGAGETRPVSCLVARDALGRGARTGPLGLAHKKKPMHRRRRPPLSSPAVRAKNRIEHMGFACVPPHRGFKTRPAS